MARVALHGSYPLTLPPEVMDRVLVLPGLRIARVALPRHVEHGKVTESLPVAVRIDWRRRGPCRCACAAEPC